ncbi:recombinase family protein [Streptomyces sp. NPDC094468]|uniref:recombinase family protein n=1 Tax=Streptomyces sp. NPDC094468 TaxID=3366066 RepID=UPI0038130B72
MVIPKRPCLYTRLSYAPDGSVEKVERQEEDGRAMGGRLNWPEFCCVYVDNSASAWQRNRKRPDWERMLLTLDMDSGRLVPTDPKASHHHDGIMVYHGDRLIRQPYDLELLLNIADTRRIPLASVSGVRDLSNSDDRFILRIEAAQACRASDDTSRRVKRGRLATARKGRMRPGGKRTFGWGALTGEMRKVLDPATGDVREIPVRDKDQTIEDELKYLRECGELVLAGLSERNALSWINKRTLTSGGRPWTQRGLKQALCAYRMAGLVENKEGDLYRAVWEPVYADEIEDALEIVEGLRAIFAANSEKYGYHGRARKHLLTGVAECADCHAPTAEEPLGGDCPSNPLICGGAHQTFSRKPINNTPYYYCKRCFKGRTQANLDAYVVGRVLRLLNTAAFLRELEKYQQQVQGDRPKVAAELVALRARKKETEGQLRQLADHPNLSPLILAESIASFDKKIAELESRADAGTGKTLMRRMAGISLEAWEQEDIAIRAEVVSTLFRILVHRTTHRGPGFDPDTIQLVRKKREPEEGSAAAVKRPQVALPEPWRPERSSEGDA